MAMSLTTFSFPTRTLYGPAAANRLPEELARLGVRRPLLVTDAGVAKTEAWRTVTTALQGDGDGVEWRAFEGVHPNPIEDDVREAARVYTQNQCDAVIGVG